MAKYDWTKLEAISAGNPVYRREPPFEVDGETWFYLKDGYGFALAISADGELTRGTAVDDELLGTPISDRFALYHKRDQLFVDVEVRGAAAIVRRGVLNGSHVATTVDPGSVDTLLARYRKHGFSAGTPWNAAVRKVTVREYRRERDKWTVRVDGDTVYESGTEEAYASREEAVARVERRITEQEGAGFRLQLIELSGARHDNPTPGDAPARTSVLADMDEMPADSTAAVDAAIAVMKKMHEQYPDLNFVAECINGDDETDLQRVRAIEKHDEYFLDMHSARLDRWSRQASAAPGSGSSWDYFARRYGSATWIVHSGAAGNLQTFYCGNVTGGGWSCLEVDREGAFYDIEWSVDAWDNPELRQLAPFHGDWHHDGSFAFDLRAEDARGEHPIVPFGENLGELPTPTDPSDIEPFGHWLFRRVVRIAKELEANCWELSS